MYHRPKDFFPRIIIPMKLELESHGHSSPERSTPAYGQNYTIQDNKGGGGGGFSFPRLTAIKQCWIDVLTF